MLNVKHLGQVFTPSSTVEKIIKLKRANGRTLEPSCGAGAFAAALRGPDLVAIEYDKSVCPDYALNLDFFDYPLTEMFDTVIGNPPFVKYRDIPSDTRAKLDMSLFDQRSNLYLFFIHKAILHLNPGGELIFICPRDFLKATASRKLNEFIHSEGTITHLEDLGDARIFPGFNPNCVIFRFEKGNLAHTTEDGRIFMCHEGQLSLTHHEFSVPFSQLFDVKVGAVSGADEVFTHPEGNMDFVCSTTVDTGETRRMIYNQEHPALAPYREKLLSRKIKAFSADNWFHWGRGFPESTRPRIYVNVKTRRSRPFFVHTATAFDGSVMALFPKNPGCDLSLLCESLNDVDWEQLGFVCDGRFIFTQRSLQNTLLPSSFNQFLR